MSALTDTNITTKMKAFIIDRTAERFETASTQLKITAFITYAMIWAGLCIGLWP